jgi:hypothetical protein
LVAAVIPLCGCAQGPPKFAKIENPVPIVRARAVGRAGRQPDNHAVPALVGRLGDRDPVVRLAAHEELRKRTGQDFGYVPWASPEERTSAISRWRAWLADRNAGRKGAMPSSQLVSPTSAPAKYSPAGVDPGARS